MHCFVRIGDATLTIIEANYPGVDMKEAHIATMQDTFEHDETKEQLQSCLLPNETAACKLLEDFARTDEPEDGGPMRTHFPNFCP